MEFKNQHVVPVSYLKAWVDPSTPEGHEPYVWMVSKDQTFQEKRAPKNILSESDFYTVIDEHGERDLELEKRLSKIESEFIRVRDTKIEKHLPLDGIDRLALTNFVSTSFCRTNLHKESQSDLWEDYQRALAFLPETPLKEQLIERARGLALQPMPYFMFHFLEISLPIMQGMGIGMYSTTEMPGFLTSDNPVLWPEKFKFELSEPNSFFGLDSPTLEIIMPISPRELVIFSKQYPEGYFPVNGKSAFVEEVNQMTIGFAENVFISCSKNLDSHSDSNL